MILIITIGVTRVLITNRVESDSLSFRLMKEIVYCYAFEFQSLEIIFEQFKYGINLNQKNINIKYKNPKITLQYLSQLLYQLNEKKKKNNTSEVYCSNENNKLIFLFRYIFENVSNLH